MIGALILALFVYTGICAVIAGTGMLLFHLSTIMRPRAEAQAKDSSVETHRKRAPMFLKAATAILGSGLIAALSPSMVMAIFS